MAGFYERLGLKPGASDEQIRDAYRQSLARMVRKLRNARAQGADTQAIEAERDEVREAYEVLTDAARRRRYDLMLRLERQGMPRDADALVNALQPALVDPAAAAGLEVLRALTQLPVGEPFTAVEEARTVPDGAPPPRPRPEPAVSMMSPQERVERARHAVEEVPEPLSLDIEEAPGSASPPPAVRGATGIDVPAPSIAVGPSVGPQAPPGTRKLTDDEIRHLAAHLGYDGRFLSQVRQARGLVVADISTRTRIASRYIEAMEANAFDRLPPAVFVRGYLRELAAVLQVDEAALVEGYMALYTAARG